MHAVLDPNTSDKRGDGTLRVESLAWPSVMSGPHETLKYPQTSVKKTQDSAISPALLSVCPALLLDKLASYLPAVHLAFWSVNNPKTAPRD